MDNKNFEVDKATYQLIEEVIGSDASPVGIDAKKTHIIILQKLQQLMEKVTRIEERLNEEKR